MEENTKVTTETGPDGQTSEVNTAGAPQDGLQAEQTAAQQRDEQNGQPVSPQENEQNGQPVPPQGYQQNGQPVPPQGYQQNGQPMPPQGYPAGGWQTPPPAGGVPGMNGTGEPPKKKNGAVAAVIVVCVLIVLLGIGAVAVGMSMFSSPKAKVFKAITATMSDGDTSFSDYLGIEELVEMTTDGEYSSELNLILEGMDDGYSDYSMVSGIGINAENSVDYDARKMTSDIKLLYNGSRLLSMDVYADDTIMGVKMPDLYEGSLVMDTETFMADYNEFYIREVGEPFFEEEFSFNIFTTKPDEQIFKKEYAADLKNIYEVIEVTKIPEKRTVSVGGKEQQCAGYTLVIPQKAVEVFLMDVFDYLKKTDASASQGEYDEMQEWLLEVLNKDLVYRIYLDKGGRMVALEYDYEITYDDETINCRADLEWTGQKHLWNDFSAEIRMENEEFDEVITMSAHYTMENETGEIRQKLTVDMTEESSEERIGFEYKASVDTSSGDTRLMLVMDSDEEEYFRVDLQGAFKDVKAGSQYRFDMDQLDLSLSEEELLMTLSGSYAIGSLRDEIEIDSGRERYILDMSEAEIEELGYEVMENLWNSPLFSMMMGY